jgi:hypothetical protein
MRWGISARRGRGELTAATLRAPGDFPNSVRAERRSTTAEAGEAPRAHAQDGAGLRGPGRRRHDATSSTPPPSDERRARPCWPRIRTDHEVEATGSRQHPAVGMSAGAFPEDVEELLPLHAPPRPREVTTRPAPARGARVAGLTPGRGASIRASDRSVRSRRYFPKQGVEDHLRTGPSLVGEPDALPSDFDILAEPSVPSTGGESDRGSSPAAP